MLRKSAVFAAWVLLLPLLAATGMSSSTAASARSAVPALSLAQVTSMTANISGMAYAALPLWAPSNYTDRGGPSFNNPTGSTAARRANITRLIRMINATAGYRVRSTRQCPRVRSQFPNEIKIALYSFSDYAAANALIAAHNRCVSVQVLMNDHLTNRQVPAFGKLQSRLGYRMGNRSWARRCNSGCRGRGGVLHSKIFLFTKAGRAVQAVGFGSTNITGKAMKVQWNDLFFFINRRRTWGQYMTTFTEMARDRYRPPLRTEFADGYYKTMLWPQYGHTRAKDRVVREMNAINCRARPTGGTGYNGRTLVSINIHAMEGDRGMWIADKIIRLHRTGCNVRVLYGMIAPRIHRYFKANGVRSRRTIFDRDGNNYAEQYTHMKQMSISGVFLGNTAARVTYTGSENFSHKTVYSDEIWVRVPGPAVWNAYQRHFNMIWNSSRYSNPKYAIYTESNTPVHARQRGAIVVDNEDLENG